MGIEWIWNAPQSELTGEADYVATKPFTAGDGELQPGDDIDKTAHSVRSLRTLHDQRYIALKSRWDHFHGPQEEPFEHGPKTTAEPVEPEFEEPEPQDPVELVDPIELVETETEVVTAETSDVASDSSVDATKAFAKHEGFGKYAVLIGDTKVARGLSKEEAEAQAGELNAA